MLTQETTNVGVCFELVPQPGIEPSFDAYKATVIPIYYKGKNLVRGKGIGPLTKRWQRLILPLN